MKQLVYFIAVGLFFTVLQVATVEAQGPACDPNPACDPSDPAGNCCPTCDPNPACVMGDPNAKPCCTGGNDGMAPPMCAGPLDTMIPCPPPGGDGHPHPPCPEGTDCGPPPCPKGTDCEGMDHHVMMDPRTEPPRPFSPADEAIYQPYADECESNGGKISEASMAILITPPHNFTRLQVEQLCQESVRAPGAGGQASETKVLLYLNL